MLMNLKVSSISTNQTMNEISKDISEVNLSADDMAERSSQVTVSAEDLSKLAAELHEMVRKF